MNSEQALGRALAIVRVGRGMSSADVAGLVGIQPNYLSLLERGHKSPSLEVLARTADALKIKLSRLIAIAEQLEVGIWEE